MCLYERDRFAASSTNEIVASPNAFRRSLNLENLFYSKMKKKFNEKPPRCSVLKIKHRDVYVELRYANSPSQKSFCLLL